MKEFIVRKVEEIREKPEHIRVRYVWTAVCVAMVLILTLWIITLRFSFREAVPADTKAIRDSIPSSVREIESQGESITQMMDSSTSLEGEGGFESE
jgi:hypothetical protein